MGEEMSWEIPDPHPGIREEITEVHTRPLPGERTRPNGQPLAAKSLFGAKWARCWCGEAKSNDSDFCELHYWLWARRMLQVQ
jgi:hypothetical protein